MADPTIDSTLDPLQNPLLDLPFPYKSEEQEPYSFETQSDDGFADAPEPLPSHIMEIFQGIALQTKYAPCEIMQEAQDILDGLKDGRLEYLGINQETAFVEFSDIEDGSIHSLHGPHVAALMQYYGPEEIFDMEAFKAGEPYSGILFEALGGNIEAYEQSVSNGYATISFEIMSGIASSITDIVPGVPHIQPCFSS